MCSVVAVLRSSDFAILLLRDSAARRDATATIVATAAAATSLFSSSLHSSSLIPSPLTDPGDSASSSRALLSSGSHPPTRSVTRAILLTLPRLGLLLLLLRLLRLLLLALFSTSQVPLDSHLGDRDNGPVAGDR